MTSFSFGCQDSKKDNEKPRIQKDWFLSRMNGNKNMYAGFVGELKTNNLKLE